MLAAVAGGGGRGAILAGAAGVGKSHLLDLVTLDLAGGGWSPLLAHGDPTRSTSAFGAFGDLLPPLTGEPDRWALVLHAGLDHLVDRAGVGQPVLVADDLHAFDLASAALVQQAVLDGRVRLVGTLRVGDPAPDAVTALWKDDLVERIDLVPLDPDETAELAEQLVGGPIDAETLARLWTWTEGNPLLVTEIVEHARQHENWRQVTGLWRLDGAPAQSPRLAGLLDERVADCPPAVADLVDAIALAGRLPIAVADALVGRVAVTTAERVRLVRVRDEHGRIAVALDHPLYGELRRAGAPPERQARLRNRLLDVVESLDGALAPACSEPAAGRPADRSSQRPASDAGETAREAPEAAPSGPGPAAESAVRGEVALGPADLALVAQWYLETGRVGSRTAGILLAAAERAWAGNAPERAAAFARRSWQLDPVDRSGHLLVSSLVRIGAIDELAVVAPEVVARAGTDRVRTLALLGHAVAVFQFANQPEAARIILREGARHVREPGWHDILLVEEASFDLQMGNIREAEAKATPKLDSPNPRAAADAASVVAPARALQGRIAEAMAAAERGLELARSLVDEFADAGQHLFHMLTALVDDGRVLDAESLALAAIDDLSGLDDRFSHAFLAVSLGRIYRMRGRPETATRWFREAAASFESVQRRGFTAWALAGLAAVRAEVGDLAGARAAVERCAAVGDHPIGVGVAETGRSLAWVDVAAGDLDAAAASLAAAAEHGLRVGEVVHAGHALHDLVRIGRAGDAAERLAGLVQGTDSTVLRACADRAAASQAGDADGLERVAQTFEALGCELLAAEAWYEASTCRPGDASARHRSTPARRAATLGAACEGARTPLLMPLGRAVGQLSRREREIAELAAMGLVRRQIAERLVISRRTVDSHLQRIYAKLGVTNREALAQALADAPGD
jgi:DNA-binding CsgD family transcriptional regulator/tetratricopeptide (TPR) repeat protein